jgi:hypothetical protein
MAMTTGCSTPPRLTLGLRAVIVPADFAMSRDMLRGVRARAERNPPIPVT